MNKKKEKNISYNTLSYTHGNLMMISTTLSICTLLVLMLLSTAFKSSVNSLITARYMSAVVSALFFVSFIVLAVAAKKKNPHMWEYSIYSIIMSVGFLSLLGTPFFLPSTEMINAIFKTKFVQAGIVGINIIYLVGTLIYHAYKSSK